MCFNKNAANQVAIFSNIRRPVPVETSETMETREYATQGGSNPRLLRRLLPNSRARATADQAAGDCGSGKVVIITGCNTGIGKASARALAAKGAEVIMAVRDVARGKEAAASILTQHPKAKLTVMHCDLASLTSVRHFTESFKQTGKPCHVLLANAGIMACPFGRTADGHELQFGVNHLGHFALVQQLMPVLRSTAQECGEAGRIVVVTSNAHFVPYPKKQGGPVRLDSIDSEFGYHPFRAYAQSKLCNLLFVRELHRRLAAEDAPVTAVACHPGMVMTDLVRHINEAVPPLLMRVVTGAFTWAFKTVEQGAATQVHLCTAPGIKGGEYYNNCTVSPSSAASHDADLGSRLWALSEEMVWAVPLAAPAAGAGQLGSVSVPGSSESEQEQLQIDSISPGLL